ncbi:MAG: AAA-like domain-containing protein [Pleurocapsa sp. MO_226.B13]|nr:AAA-like domain-containing protein [Pleurocapsa sp. MO_226.B13]
MEKVKLALLRNSFPSQRALALELGLALSTVSRFCTGKPVDYSTFVDICDTLSLEWKDLADLSHTISSIEKAKSKSIPLKLNLAQEQSSQSKPSQISAPKFASISSTITTDNNQHNSLRSENLPFPEGIVPPDSPLYQPRDGIESTCYETVIKPASLIRIKAPKLMGKTSLMMKVLAYAQSQNYQTVYLDLSSVDRNIVTDLDKFLRYLSVIVGKQLGLNNQLNDFWDLEILGSNGNCTAYFEEYLLPLINCPVVLALDEVDRLFPYDPIVEDFLGMLRSWHEKGKISPIWQNLRLLMAHSTEVYISLDLNQSPFNAGVPVELLEFNTKQIESLATLHQLDWQETDIEKLIQILGGHPYLIRLAMYHISCGQIALEELLANASKEVGIYSHHLRRHLEILQQKPSLAKSFKQVVTSDKPVELNPRQIYQLYSMGLVQLQDNQVIPRCNLYRDYFSRVL